ncbi:MAG: magnesium chelatase [Candidatus Hydrogenedentota bacterium]
MLARVQSSAIFGIDGIPLSVEVDNYPGIYKFTIVGLPDAAVKESQERVGSAIKNSGFRAPRGVTVVNLAPADIRKEGSALDLPIAIGILAASDQIKGERLAHYSMIGELALNGAVRPVAGALPMTIAARDQGLVGILVPGANAQEAGVVPGINVIPVERLVDAASFLSGTANIEPTMTNVDDLILRGQSNGYDLSDVKGQASAKRALIIAASGGHNLLMVGPPGTGKTMLASRLPGILPDMTFDEALETTRIYSVAGTLTEGKQLITHRPFRAPHHTATTVAISGGGHGQRPMPGEVSMAHNGVLFLDELPEFNRGALEVLRQPLEDGLVHIRRAMYSVTFPSRFLLVVALNSCPCGYRSHPAKTCRCTIGEIQRYMSRLSGPLLDRIDLHIDVPALTYDEISDRQPSGPTSAEVRIAVQKARNRQRARHNRKFACNAHLDSKAVREICTTESGAGRLLQNAMEQLGLSARAYDKVLRVARTIADLDESDLISESHVGEAIQYRSLDRQLLSV